MERGEKMLNLRSIGIVGLVLSSFLFGCAINVTNRVNNQLDLQSLNQRLETQPTDLTANGKCPGTKSLKIINAETRTGKYCVNEAMGCKWYIIPKDMIDDVVKHIENKLRESKIKTGNEFGNEILISLENIKTIEGVWSFGSTAKIKIHIPDIDYTKTYVGESGSGLGFHALAYAIHLSIDSFIKDPAFQNYIKCQ